MQLEAEKLQSSDMKRKLATLQGRLCCLKVAHDARGQQQASIQPQVERKPPPKFIRGRSDHLRKDQSNVS